MSIFETEKGAMKFGTIQTDEEVKLLSLTRRKGNRSRTAKIVDETGRD